MEWGCGGSRPLCASKAPLGLRPPPSPCEYTLYVGISIAFDVLVLSLFLCFDLPRYVTGLGCIPSPPLSGLEKVGRFHMGKLAGALEASKPAEPETEQAMNELTQRTPPTLTRAPVESGVGGQADTGGQGSSRHRRWRPSSRHFPFLKLKGFCRHGAPSIPSGRTSAGHVTLDNVSGLEIKQSGPFLTSVATSERW